MEIKQLSLENFRNYGALTLGLEPGVNIFHGPNGRGKTNLLEAVFICTSAVSHRSVADADLIKTGENRYRIGLIYEPEPGLEEELDLHYLQAVPGDPLRPKTVRTVRYNGMELDKISQLPGLFNAVMFGPDDMNLIKSSPRVRRRFLDLLIVQIRPVYFSYLQEFQQILKQRNRLLKSLRESNYRPRPGDPYDFKGMELDIWDERYALAAGRVAAERRRYVSRLTELAGAAHAMISGGKETLEIRYQAANKLPAEDLADYYQNELSVGRQEDLKRGYTLIGPHRDDLEIKLNQMEMKKFASQGQQRTAALAMKIGEMNLIEEKTYRKPVLLLDDVMSELDESRRERLVSRMEKTQILLTCTEAELVSRQINELKKNIEVATYRVGEGTVDRE